jgi:hypothetical protein
MVKGLGNLNMEFICQRGTIRPCRGHSGQTSTTKIDCPWKVTAKTLAKNDRKWQLEVKSECQYENHAGNSCDSHPQLILEHKAFIAQFTNRIVISNREVATSLRNQFPCLVFTLRQVRNFRYRLHKAASARYTPFQATMKLLDDERVAYYIK